MATPSAQQEPSMEEILASIRRIISEDSEPGKQSSTAQATTAAKESDVLELTNIVHDDGTVGRIESPAEAPPQPRRRPAPTIRAPEPEPMRAPEPRLSRRAAPPERPMRNDPDLDMVDKDDREGGILSSQASSAITNAFGALARERDVSIGGGASLEDLVTQMMKPMLAAWLEEHLPEIVERVVQQEVERAARTSGRRR
jgi:cell pole-organizing protein PopZ